MTPGRVVAAAAAAYASVFSFLSIRRYESFELSRFDLGNMTQAVWNTAHGRFLETSDAFGETFVRLGVHVDPLLAAFAPLYRIWPDPRVLLIAQAAIVAAGAWPAYKIARAELADAWTRGGTGREAEDSAACEGAAACTPSPELAAAERGGALLAGAYLLYPPLQWSVLDEFHAVTLAAPLLLFAVWFLRERRYLPFAVVAVAAALSKEEIGFLIALLGLYAVFVWQDRRAGLVTAVLGAAWSIAAFELIIPEFTPIEGGPFSDRYAAVGGSMAGIVETALTDPLTIVREALGARELGYLGAQLAPFLLLPLLAPAALLVAAPEFAANLLSSQHAQTSWRFHYVAGQTPFIWWAAVLGIARLTRLMRRRHTRTPPARTGREAEDSGGTARGWRRLRRARITRRLPALVALSTFAAGYAMGPIPLWSKLPGAADHRAGSYSPDDHDRVARRAVKEVPDGTTISVSNRMGAHLSHRRSVALFPEVGDAEYVVVDLRNPSYGERNGQGDADSPVAREQAAALRALRLEGGYATAFAEDGVVVLRRR